MEEKQVNKSKKIQTADNAGLIAAIITLIALYFDCGTIHISTYDPTKFNLYNIALNSGNMQLKIGSIIIIASAILVLLTYVNSTMEKQRKSILTVSGLVGIGAFLWNYYCFIDTFSSTVSYAEFHISFYLGLISTVSYIFYPILKGEKFTFDTIKSDLSVILNINFKHGSKFVNCEKCGEIINKDSSFCEKCGDKRFFIENANDEVEGDGCDKKNNN